jgi:ATP-binding cassette subfamily B protein
MTQGLKEFLIDLITKYKFYLMGLICVSISGGAFGTFVNYQVKEIIDSLGNASLFSGVIMFVIYVTLNHLVFFISRLLDIKYKPTMLAEVVDKAYRKTMKHSLHWFDSHLSGEIASKITDLQDSIITVITVISRSLTMFCFIVIGLVFIFQVNYIPGLVLLGFLIIYSPIMIKLLKKQLELQEQYVSSRQESVGIINDSISNVFGIKIIGNLFTELHLKLLPSIRKWSDWDRKTRQYDAYYVDVADTIMSVIMNATQIFILGYLYQNSYITAGEFAFIAGTTLQIHNDLDSLLENIMFAINPKIATIKSSFKFIKSDLNHSEITENLPSVQGNIEYKDVKFGYNNEKNVFENLNLKIEKSQKIGIVGTSGAGKTTLIKCLLKYFDLKEGEILIDGYDISKYSEESLRANISVIPQDITMFHRSIIDNLQLAKYDAKIDEIQSACKKAKIHDDIMMMPQGYDTIVGERGVKLSGGQRQRIAIARAILKDAPILILDEATSALDTPTEILIQQSINEILEGSKSTMIVIAHRLSTLIHMDRIIVLENGKIVEDGSHNDLIKNEGIYKKLWDSQVGGFII